MRQTIGSTISLSPYGRTVAPDAYPATEQPSFLDVIGFTPRDLLWSLALWITVLGLAPFAILFVLMVN